MEMHCGAREPAPPLHHETSVRKKTACRNPAGRGVGFNHRMKAPLAGFILLAAACSDADPPRPSSTAAPVEATGPAAWSVPDGFRSETIPFPLEFAPGLAHRGVEELRFAPGFFDPAAPGYWSYAFVWRLEDAAALDAAGIARELETYFRGLLTAVDPDVGAAARDRITVATRGAAARWDVSAHVVDAFKTKQPLELVGTAERRACGAGALWVFTLAPPGSGVRRRLAALASEAACGQTPVPNRPR
jgi:hypothetical protein